MSNGRGVVAAGHPATVQAAEAVLCEGGNAFDAVVAAHFAACVAEPVLCSLAGGGFLLAHANGAKPLVYDFFAQTPQQRRATTEIDFYPILADFGTAQQEFHIGLGAVATPGNVRGLFAIHRDLCSMPMTRLVEPAIHLAREGIQLNDFQAYIFSIIEPIYLATPASRHIFADPDNPRKIIGASKLLQQHDQADFLEALAREGEDLFYRGEIAAAVSHLSHKGGGHLSRSDFESYRVKKREPLSLPYRDAQVFINPPPSSGGLLIAFALDLLAQVNMRTYPFGSSAYLQLLCSTMALTNHARSATHLDETVHPDAAQLLNPAFLQQYREQISGRARSFRGTTHISVVDAKGNIASMTVSNGEGSGHIIPHTGVMLNNMLGEEDINPCGFHRWPVDQRMTSMMAPAIVLFKNGRQVAIGSGGSNRIRSAILQVLLNLIDYRMPVEAAVNAPRIHLEGELLSIENGFKPSELIDIMLEYPQHTVWPTQNLFFGGAHTVMSDTGNFYATGDPRRGGAAAIVG
ncbi:MAG: gamma-glutamyltransferase [Gammaproteobacteria bacterium]